MIENYKQVLQNRFLKYVSIDTRSDDSSISVPSTARQFNLARSLETELNSLGLKEVKLNDKCYLSATLPSNDNLKHKTIGFIAHMDTSPELSGENVNPQIISNYTGNEIVLNKELNIVLSPVEFPFLKNYIGQTLITSDGTTLLGADNKAGIAEIITAVSFLLDHPEIKHGDIRLGFTPDEEIGRGADHFDVENFKAEFAYTVDSGEIGNLEYETFNAASAKVIINGKNVHPGNAKGIMMNAQLIAMEFSSLLPINERPENTDEYEGFYHLIKMEGSVERAVLQYIIRDHDEKKFEVKKSNIMAVANMLNVKYKPDTVRIELKDQYYNMRKKIEPVMYIIEKAKKAYLKAGIQPKIAPIRGGTDGARLSYMGLPTPNIFTGGHNFHSRYEFIPLESMIKAMEVIINIARTEG